MVEESTPEFLGCQMKFLSIGYSEMKVLFFVFAFTTGRGLQVHVLSKPNTSTEFNIQNNLRSIRAFLWSPLYFRSRDDDPPISKALLLTYLIVSPLRRVELWEDV